MARRGGERIDALLHWLVGTAVVGQANRVAITKLLQQGLHHFFISQDEEGYRVVPRLKPTDYVKYDEPRFESGDPLLTGLGLVDDSDGLHLTRLGQERLLHNRAQLEEMGSAT